MGETAIYLVTGVKVKHTLSASSTALLPHAVVRQGLGTKKTGSDSHAMGPRIAYLIDLESNNGLDSRCGKTGFARNFVGGEKKERGKKGRGKESTP